MSTDVALPTMWRALTHRGYTYKMACVTRGTHEEYATRPDHAFSQLSKKAIERLEFKRSAYCVLIGELYSREQLVFVDESAMDRRLTYRTHGWAMKGKRASKKGHFKRGKK